MTSRFDALKPSTSHPNVSILTPTYNRAKFIPALIACVRAQTYPRERTEWIILDDGNEPVRALLEPYIDELNIRYIRVDTKMTVGAKRNRLHAEAHGTILVNMDDDDYYPPDRVSHAVMTLLSKKVQLVGCSRNHLYFTDDESIWEVGPYPPPYHATFGTMAYTKKYAMAHPCDEYVSYAEELQFTNHYKEPLAQLDPFKVMLVMCHADNTVSKHKVRNQGGPMVRKTGLKLRGFIRDKELREFYASCK
jgi:glycosyltransferase involved in cell wall biosynthesis